MSQDTPTARPSGIDRLRRSLHFVPGANEKMLNRSLSTAADALILDLEDAVTPARKDDARCIVADWLKRVDFGHKERIVRMNPLGTSWGLKDIAATMAHPPDAYLVPKVSTLGDLQRIDAEIRGLEQVYGHPPGDIGLIALGTETPLGVLNLPTLTQCSRMIALSWGAEDLSAALGSTRSRRPDFSYLDVYRHCRVQTLLAAAAGGVQPVDTVFVEIRDLVGLQTECHEAAWMGFTGKMTIHPDQIDIVNAAFTPSTEEVSEAKRLLATMAEAERCGRMSIAFEGKMVDVPHLNRAKRILARARMIEESQ